MSAASAARKSNDLLETLNPIRMGEVESHHRKPRKLLFVSRILVAGAVSGPDEYTKAVLECLSANGFDVEYLWLGTVPDHKIWHRLPDAARNLGRVWSPFTWRFGNFQAPRDLRQWLWTALRRLGNFARRFQPVQNSSPFQKFDGLVSRNLRALKLPFGDGVLPDRQSFSRFAAVYEQVRPEIVMVNYYVLSPLFDQIAGQPVSKVILTHNASHEGIDRDSELACLRKADLLLAIQAEDAAELRKVLPGRDVLLFPVPFDIVESACPPVPGRVVFVGGNHRANAEGLEWFLQNVWPRIQDKVPAATFHVCGSVCENFKEKIPGVHFLGRLDSLSREFGEARVAVVPLLDGTGLKIKLVDALRHGRPVVATSTGLQGVSFTEGVCVVRADSSDEFASAVVRLFGHDDEWQTMHRNAGRVVREHFSREACIRPFLKWCDDAANPARPPAELSTV